MRTMMAAYGERGYCELAAHGYRMTGDAIIANRPYTVDCPALLLCGEHDETGFVMRSKAASSPTPRKRKAQEGA